VTDQSSKSLSPAVVKRPRGRPRDGTLHERRREQILERASVVFAKVGYPNTDVQDIADPLGISKGTIYRYFPTKEQLFLATVERGVRQLDAAMDKVLQTVADPVERLAVGTVTYLRFFEANPGLVELFIQERAEFRDKRKPVYFEHGCKSECQWQQTLEQLIASRRLRNVPVERIMTVVGNLLYGTMFTNYFLGPTASAEQQAADINDILFNGVLSERERSARAGNGAAGRSKNGGRTKSGKAPTRSEARSQERL